MKTGDLIKCNDDDDARRIFRELDKEGIGAVRAGEHWILITSVPKKGEQK